MAGFTKILDLLLVFTFAATTTSAFFFRRHDQVARANGKAIRESCLELADRGDCGFYACFENRLPCGRNGYIVKTGHHYCNKMRDNIASFNIQGQRFVNDTQLCLIRSLVELYRRDSVRCQEIEDAAISAIPTCFVENAFCDILEENASHFVSVYEVTDFLSSGTDRIWRAVASLVTRCGTEVVREISSNTVETVIDAINSFFEYVSNSVSF